MKCNWVQIFSLWKGVFITYPDRLIPSIQAISLPSILRPQRQRHKQRYLNFQGYDSNDRMLKSILRNDFIEPWYSCQPITEIKFSNHTWVTKAITTNVSTGCVLHNLVAANSNGRFICGMPDRQPTSVTPKYDDNEFQSDENEWGSNIW